MKKILGLDIGSSSVGWALVHEPTEAHETYTIAGMGVRIIPYLEKEKSEFESGNAISKNRARTQARGMRRNLQRYKLRRHKLTALLRSLGMLPGKELFALTSTALYELHDRGVTGQLSPEELGRVWLHLNQKRGYKSNRKANNDEEQAGSTDQEPATENARPKKKGYLDFINDREQALKDEGITIGQHFYKLLLAYQYDFAEGKPAQAVRIKENVYLRSSYIEEFDRIWNQQQQFYPDLLTDANKNTIRDEIIYYQRPLRSQKGLVSNCLFEKHHKAAPKSSPLFQVSKIWQELNNVEITSFNAIRLKEPGFDEQGKRKLTLEEKQGLFAILNVEGKLTTKKFLEKLGYKTGQSNYKLNIRNEKELEGNRTFAAIKKVFDKFDVDSSEVLRFDLTVDEKELTDQNTGEIFTRLQINPDFEREPLFQLWHLLYAAEENEALIAKLQSRYNFTVDVAKALARIDFAKQGHGNLSAKALRKIVPYLQQGYMYSEACEMAGYNHSNSINKAENNSRPLVDKLELYPKNSLRQPVVEKIINQVINLVNTIIDEHNGFVTNEERYNGTFEIRVELARELRQNAEERNRTYSRNSQQDRKHKEIIDIIKQHLPFKRVTKNDIERYKLWEEFGRVSPYEPNSPVSLGALFSGEYDIEHIIPKSRLFDDSYTNKTICRRILNSGSLNSKNQMTAYDFMKAQGEQVFMNYLEFIKTHLNKKDGITKGKFNKLMTSADKIPDDFINRQLQETRFITREVRTLLSRVCRNINATTGSVTDYLRHYWGYDTVLQKLNWHKYERAGKTAVEHDKHGKPIYRIIDWSKRDDHRHHAIDALVIACTKQGYINQLNDLNKTVERKRDQTSQDAIKQIDIKAQIPFAYQQVLEAVDSILISFKAGKKVAGSSTNKIKKADKSIQKQKELTPRGFLHKETVFGRIKKLERVSLSPRFARVDDIAYPEMKARVTEQIEKFNGNIKEAFSSKNLALFKEMYGVSEVELYTYEHVVRYKLDANFKAADAEYIVDEGIKAVVKNHLAKHGNNSKVAFNGEPGNVVWLNKEKGIPVRSVRCFTGYTDLQSLHTNEHGQPIDFVVTGNNHHMAIYLDETGKLQENTVSFWNAVKRKQVGLPVIIKEPEAVWNWVIDTGFDDQEILKALPGQQWIYQTSLQQNEMFVFGLAKDELDAAIGNNDHALISKHLYRTQKISKNAAGAINIWFRHHLETKLDDGATAKELKKFINIQSLGGLTGIKVKIDNIGKLHLV